MAQPITSVPATSGQEKQLVRFVADAAESAAKSAVAQADFLDKDGAQLVIACGNRLKVFIEQATVNALRQLSSRYPMLVETKFLKPVATATTKARTNPFDASEFFQNRLGLYVCDLFRERLDIENCKPVPSAPKRPYVALLLKANAYDQDIRKELPEQHLSTLEDIAGFIEAQLEGKSGFFMNNDHANIFYVESKNGEVFAVHVYWHSDRRRGYVGGWRSGEYGQWLAGCQVLCPGNALL